MTTNRSASFFLRLAICLAAAALLSSENIQAQDYGSLSRSWKWEKAGKGIQAGSAQIELFGSTQSISVIRYKASRRRTEIVNDPADLADSTSALAARHRAAGAINGSYFDVKKLTPVTYVKDDGRQEGWTTMDETFRTDGMLTIKGGHRISIMACDQKECHTLAEGCREAMAAGPVLLKDGRLVKDEWPEDSFFTRRHPRTLIGTTSDGWVYFIVIDGRAKGNAAGATIAETARIAFLFGLEDAINLDGGGSSTLWTRRYGVMSNPTDNHAYDHNGQRTVPNVVLFK